MKDKNKMYEIVTDNPLKSTTGCVLYQVCNPVVDFEEAAQILSHMHDHINVRGAFGIAANQVGVPLRMFSMKKEGEFLDFINPVITYFSLDTEFSEEGCLSFPDLYVKVRRSTKIELTWFDIHGNECSGSYIDLWARVIQHEMDHLMGKRFFDSANKIHKDAAFRKYVNLHRKRRKTS